MPACRFSLSVELFFTHSCLIISCYFFSFSQVRDEEGTELNELKKSVCRLNIEKSGTVDTDVSAKVNALLQGYISRHQPSCHSLASDMNYIHQNAGRVVRYLFEISLRQGWAECASSALQLARVSCLLFWLIRWQSSCRFSFICFSLWEVRRPLLLMYWNIFFLSHS